MKAYKNILYVYGPRNFPRCWRVDDVIEPPAMRKMTWEVTSPNKPRCEICKGRFGLVRYRIAQKQFCSKQCLERYLAERMQRISSVKRSIDLPKSD